MTVINTNISALRARTASTNAQNELNTTFERLSTGRRINSARDDAAGLSIATNFTSDIRVKTGTPDCCFIFPESRIAPDWTVASQRITPGTIG